MALSNVGHVTSATYLSYPHALGCDGNYVYAGNATGGYFTIIDVTDPANPSIDGYLSSASYNVDNSYQLCYDNDYVYYSSRGDACCTIINVTDRSNPSEVTTIAASQCLGVAKEGDYVYISSYGGYYIDIYDVSTPGSPSYKSRITGVTKAGNLAIDGNYLYFCRDDRVGVADVSNKSSPSIKDTVSDADWTNPLEMKIAKYGNYIYVTGSSYFRVVDVTVPTNIVKKGSLSISGISAVYQYLGNIYVTNTAGLYKMDVSDPDNPSIGTSITGAGNYAANLISVAAINGYVYAGSTSDYISVFTDSEVVPPDPPTAISVTEGEDKNTISFTADPSATDTHIYWSNSSPVTVSDTKISSVTSPHEHTSLDPDLTYYYILTSENVYGEGTTSSEYDGQPYPAAPSNVAAVAGFEKNTISWDSVNGADSYNIYWLTTSPVTKLTGTKITGATSPYDHTSLTKNQPYYYVVVAENETGEGADSSEVTATPFGTPDAPTSISVTKGGGENVITYTVDPEATQTHIYWGNSPGVTILTGTKISDVSSPYTHASLDPSLTYYYILTSENVYGEGDPTSEYSDSPYPAIPTGVGVTAGIEKNVIEWTSVLGADSYNIYWRYTAGVTKVNGTKITGVTSPYTHSGLAPYVTVYYIVTAEDEDGESDISSEVSGQPAPPIGPSIPQPPVDQYSILDVFSDNDFENVSKLTFHMIGTPPVTGYNKDILDLYDLYEDIDFNSCLTDDSFDIEEVSSTSVKVTTGRCVIGGVGIDIKRDTTLIINDEESYFDWVNAIAGAGTVYILAYYDSEYDAELEESLAYIGLMKKTDYTTLTTTEKKSYCFIGAIKINSSVEIITPLYYWDPDDTSQGRPHPKGFADGGWLDIPDEFIV